MLGLLSALTALVLDGQLRGLDDTIEGRLAPLRHAALVPLWLFISEMGSNGALAIVAVVASTALCLGRRSAELRPLWLAGAGALATTWGAKFLLALPRPELGLVPLPVSPTFPSAHATGAMALYGILAWLAGRRLRRSSRLAIACAAALLIAAIGASRVLLGVHYASDVAAGFLVGAFWLLVAIATAPRESSGAA